MDPAGILENAKQVAEAASCVHDIFVAVQVSVQEFANGNYPYCDFNPGNNGELHLAVNAAGE